MILSSTIFTSTVKAIVQIAHKTAMVATVTSTIRWHSLHRRVRGLERICILLLRLHCHHTESFPFPPGVQQSNSTTLSLSTSRQRPKKAWTKWLSRCIQANQTSSHCSSSTTLPSSTVRRMLSPCSLSHLRNGQSSKTVVNGLALLQRIPFSALEEISSKERNQVLLMKASSSFLTLTNSPNLCPTAISMT